MWVVFPFTHQCVCPVVMAVLVVCGRAPSDPVTSHTNTHPRVHMVGRDQSDVRGWTRARWFSRRATVKYITSKLQQIIICHIPENWMKCKLFWIVNAVGKQCHTSEMSCGKSLYHSMNCCMQREYKPVITFPPDLQWLSTSALIYIRELLAN